MKAIKAKVLILTIIVCLFAGVGLYAQNSANDPLVSLDLRDVDVRSAIDMLFRGTGKNYTIASDVQGMIASFKATNVPFDTALKSLTRSANLVYRVDQGMYHITNKPDPSTTGAMGMGGIPGVGAAAPTTIIETTATRETIIDKIPLNHIGATELLAMISGGSMSGGGYGMSQLGNRFGNSGFGSGGIGSSNRFGTGTSTLGRSNYGGSSFGNSNYGSSRSNYGGSSTSRW